jgi:hypothetical protein
MRQKLERWFVAMAVMLSFPHAAHVHAEEKTDPAQALAWAVERYVTCPARLEESAATSKAETTDIAIAEKLTMSLVFRAGRFALEWQADEGEERVLAFKPWADKSRWLKPEKGESGDFNKALNHLAGTIRLDKETGEFTRIEGRLTEAVWIFPKWYKPLRLSRLAFSYTQAARPEGWQPERLTVDAEAYFIEKYFPLRFDCSAGLW